MQQVIAQEAGIQEAGIQEVTIKEAETVVGGTAGSFGNGLIASTPFGYLIGLAITHNRNPGKWNLC